MSLARAPDPPLDTLINDVGVFQTTDVNAGSGATHLLLYRQLPRALPRWATFFKGQTSSLDGLRNQSCGALLIVRRPCGTFVVSFGQAHHSLIDEAFEERFGLIVALNSVERDRLRKVDSVSLSSKGRHASVQVGVPGSFGDFGLDVDSDLVRKVAVVPEDKGLLGSQLVGRQALSLSVPTSLTTLDSLLDALHERFTDPGYKDRHSWLDNVHEVRDRTVIDRLDALMLAAFRDPGSDARLWAAVPEVVEWERIDGFTYSNRADVAPYPDLHVDTMRASFVRKPLTDVSVATLKSKTVYAKDPDGSYPSYHWSIYRCLYCEVHHDGDLYVLTNNSWFRVAPDFVRSVDADLTPLREDPDLLRLPDYDDNCERLYNARVARERREFACMDARNVFYGGGRSQIELCDLVSTSGVLVFVKRYGGSAPLSHLFAQGAVSANLMAFDAIFRNKVNEKLPPTHQLQERDGRFVPQDHTLVYAITTRKDVPILDSLPFFSKVGLRHAFRLLRGFGYRVQVIGIRDRRCAPHAGSSE